MSFPNLKSDISLAPVVEVENYKFKVFSVGERGTSLSPELIQEVVNGLVSIAKTFAFDSIVSIHVTGAMWALPVAMALNKPLKLFTTEPNGSNKQQSFEQKRPYMPRLIYTPDLSQMGKCIIIDDVLSGGSTISQLKNIIEEAGGEVLGAICVIDKMSLAPNVSDKIQIPIICLANGTS